jgi:hypothetical protein
MLRASGEKYRWGKIQISDVDRIREKSTLVPVSCHEIGRDWKCGTQTAIAGSFLGKRLKQLLNVNFFIYLTFRNRASYI